MWALFRNLDMLQNNPFAREASVSSRLRRSDFFLSAGIHLGIIVLLLAGALILGNKESVPAGGGEFISVEMVVLHEGDDQAEAAEIAGDTADEIQTEEVVEEEITESAEVQEVIEPAPEEVQEEVEPEEPAEVQETVQEEVEELPASSEEFIGVGAQGEAGAGAPGPASYEGRVFGAIRRNFRTSVVPPQSYRISFVVNLDNTTSYSTIRESGNSSFDRAVVHALTSAGIPPIPPGRTEPVQMNIEFFGPDQI
ncbi:hypothetical protein CSA37_12475 [Candidatus Fermentibacteria bacterium]|nr:MAG: hypothetical protein CSA37_12475 [Candidatus Fermentibacteria bacterium]